MQNFAQVQNGRLAPPMGHNAHTVGENRPEVEKLMIINPRTGGGLSQPRTGGGGVDFSPPP